MESYTNFKLKTTNNTLAYIVAGEIASVVLIENPNDMCNDRIARFINEMVVDEKEVIIDNSCSLTSYEYNQLIPFMYKTASRVCEAFIGESDYTSCNCGYMATIDAHYSNMELTITKSEEE